MMFPVPRIYDALPASMQSDHVRATIDGLLCMKCGGRYEPNPFASKNAILDGLEAFLVGHLHEPPKPLTAAEREQVKVRLIHKRGALGL